MKFLTGQRFTVSLYFFLSGFCFSSWGSRIPDLKDKLSLDESELGLMLLILPIGSMVAMPFAGYLVNKIGSKRVLLYTLLIYTSSLAMIGFSYTLVPLIISIFMFGAMGNFYNIAVNTQAIIVQNIYQRPIMASFHGLWSIAGFIGGFLSTFVFAYSISTDLHMATVAVITLVLALITYKNLAIEIVQESENKGFLKPDAYLIRLGIISFCGMMCEGCMFDWSGVYFEEVLGAKKGMITAGYVSFFAAMAGGRFIADKITHKIGIENIFILSGTTIFIGLALSVLFPTIPVCIAGFLLVGLGTSAVIPSTFSGAGKSKIYSAGVALTFVSSIGFLGFLLGPPIIGFLADLFNLRTSFFITALFGLSITMLALIEKKKANTPA